jgi:hypothetical protein
MEQINSTKYFYTIVDPQNRAQIVDVDDVLRADEGSIVYTDRKTGRTKFIYDFGDSGSCYKHAEEQLEYIKSELALGKDTIFLKEKKELKMATYDPKPINTNDVVLTPRTFGIN